MAMLWSDRKQRANPKRRAAYQRRKRTDPDWIAARNRDSVSRARKVRSNILTWPKWAILIARLRAKRLKILFDITEKDIEVPTHCPVFGTAFKFGGPRNHPDLPTLDRLRNERGYVKGNIRVISYRANRLKSNVEHSADLRAVADWMECEGL